jgi:lysophospholipid acyltransferase (LPLAT)-like uncharacterized protein
MLLIIFYVIIQIEIYILYLSKSPDDGLLPSPYLSNKYFTISPTASNQESTQNHLQTQMKQGHNWKPRKENVEGRRRIIISH